MPPPSPHISTTTTSSIDEIVSTYQRRWKQSMRIEDVKSTIKKQWIATHTYIKGLGLDVNGNAIPLLAGFIGPVGEKDGRKGTAPCRATYHREAALSIAQKLGSKVLHLKGDKQDFEFVKKSLSAEGFDVAYYINGAYTAPLLECISNQTCCLTLRLMQL